MSKRTITIADNETGKSVECPVYTEAYAALVVGIGNLCKELRIFTLDTGYAVLSFCRGAIAYLGWRGACAVVAWFTK
ncbi:MAG: hypothetical protein O3C28_03515 [Proteobacteria bacterium]|nr:hypothetical protein [Pseudomonadota bacterium]